MTETLPVQETRVAVEAIRVEGRHRREFGDIESLAKDIEANGLIHAVALTADNRLIAGERRLRAMQRLGWATVPARYLTNVTDAASVLRAERAENTCRKDMLPGEIASLGAALEELERPKAKERQGTRVDLGRELRRTGTAKSDGAAVSTRTSEVIAAGLGISPRTYERTRAVHKAAHDESLPPAERDRAQKAMDEMDRTETVTPVYNRWKAGDTFPAPVTPEPSTAKPPGKKPVNRKPLPDAARDAGYDLQKSVERVGRVVADDRFPKNAEQVATHLRHHLLRSIDALTEALAKLSNSQMEPTE